MQITAIRNRLMRVARQNWHFVQVETDAGLMLDNHGQLAPGDAIDLARALAPFGLLFSKSQSRPILPMRWRK